MLLCKVCGGMLRMNPLLTGAVCTVCGVFYPIAVLQNMQGQASAPHPAAPVQPARPVVQPAAPVQPARPVEQPAAPVQPARPVVQSAAPVQPARPVVQPAAPAQPAAGPTLQNERYGLAPSEYRQFRTTGSFLTALPPEPVPISPFASPAVRAEHERQANARQAAEHRLHLQRQVCDKEKYAREAYFKKFYETTYPRYGREEWTPYFESILRECFPAYALKKAVPVQALVRSSNIQAKADFALYANGVPKLAIFLSDSRKRARPKACGVCIQGGLPALTFFMPLSNRRDYVIQRVEKALQT